MDKHTASDKAMLTKTTTESMMARPAGQASGSTQPNATPTPPVTIKKGVKRRRTRSHNSSPSPGRGFFVPGFQEGSGHKMMSMNELMDAAKGVTNMFLAHEIAVDKDFHLEKLNKNNNLDDEESGGMEARIKKIVHQAFWDVLASELAEEPPVFNQALNLLDEVRNGLCNMLLPNQHRIKQAIMEKLDIDLIRQQAENGALNFQDYAEYVVDLMGKLCAPVRDDDVAALKEIKDVVPLFQGILKTLDKMRLDMANFVIQQARPMIMSQSVNYEKIKFKEFLATQNDGLEFTRAWLLRHKPSQDELEQSENDTRGLRKLLMSRTINEAFVELLQWDEYYPLPETLAMDQKRVLALRDQTERTSVSTAVVLVAFSNISGLVVPADSQTLKEKVKSHVDVLLQDFFDDTDLLRILPNVALQVVQDINQYLSSKGKPELPESTAKNLKDQITEMEDPNARIRDLVQRRLVEFNKQAISGSRAAPLQIPPGLTVCQKELAQIAGGFVRLVSYNRAVFDEFYDEILVNHVMFLPTKESTSSKPPST